VDENYKVHISYYDWTNGALKHAWKSLPTNPRIAISPQSYDFGTVRLGSPRSVEIILSNYGTADLIISDMDLSNEDDFSLDVDGGSNPAGSTNPQIVPGEERSVVIVFDPSTIGLSYDATLTIFSNDPTYPEVEIELSGNAFPGTGNGVCFIATAAYGTSIEGHVGILRDFRDSYLLSYKLGLMFVNTYYRYSPSMADFISKHDTLKTVVQVGLLPLVAVSYSAVHLAPKVVLAMFIIVLMLPIFLVFSYRRRLHD